MLQAAIILLLAVLKEIKLILSFKAAGLNVLHDCHGLSYRVQFVGSFSL